MNENSYFFGFPKHDNFSTQHDTNIEEVCIKPDTRYFHKYKLPVSKKHIEYSTFQIKKLNRECKQQCQHQYYFILHSAFHFEN